MKAYDRPCLPLARSMTIVAFVVLLAGQYSFDRIGGAYQWPIPLNALVAGGAIVVFANPSTVALSSRSWKARPIPGFRSIIWFLLLLMMSGMWSAASTVDPKDYWNVLTMLLTLFLLRLALSLSRETAVNTFMAMSVGAGLVFALAGLLSVGVVSRIAAFGGGSNVFARITGMAMIAVIYFVIKGTRTAWFTLLLAPLGAATVLSGSRGAMLGTVVALVVLSLALDRHGLRQLAIGFALASPAIFVVYAWFGTRVLQTVELRIVRLTLEEGYTSGRGDLWSEAWIMFQDHPLFGAGLGSFTDRYHTYPHNLVLQTAAELGLAGLVSLSMIILVCLVRMTKHGFRAPSVVAPIAGACLVLVASQFSGGFYDTRFLWAYIVIALSQPLKVLYFDPPVGGVLPVAIEGLADPRRFKMSPQYLER